MDSMNFDWLDHEKSIVDSLGSSMPTNTMDTTNDILRYLLQDTESNINTPGTSLQPQPHQNQMTFKSTASSSEFRSKLSIVPSEDNFVTFTPLTDSSKKSTGIKKTKFKEPIFVTESPQNSYKKKKLSLVNNSSGEENSDDDMLLDHVPNSTSNSKKMTSKERRQIRNKISARNFRVRRKEYITQLEEKVEEHEKTIANLTQENLKLRTANDEFMKQMLNQPITPPPSDELTSSGSEGHYSPEAGPVTSIFQFQLNDLYDMSLFDQQQQEPIIDTSNLFYLNHAVIPDWDIRQVLGEKGRPISLEETQHQISRELLVDYPLLAPALMSIVINHTMSLDYVASLAKELSESNVKNFNGEVHSDDIIKKMDMLRLEQSKDNGKSEKKEEIDDILSDEELLRNVLNDHFPNYCFMRARGKSHEQTMKEFRHCYEKNNSKCKLMKTQKLAKDEKKQSKKTQIKLSALHTYCKIAGTLLRRPQRMAFIKNVIKEEISFAQNKHIAKIENNYTSMFSPIKNLRIAGTSK